MASLLIRTLSVKTLATGLKVCVPARKYGPIFYRTISRLSCPSGREFNGLVLGVYSFNEDEGGGTQAESMRFTKSTQKYDEMLGGQITTLLRAGGKVPENGDLRLLYGLAVEYPVIAVVGLGKECMGYNDVEERDDGKEAIRIASAVGCQALQKLEVKTIFVEGFGHAESSAEGAALGIWLYQELKNKNHQLYLPQLDLHDDCDWTGWQIGLQKAAAQNLARQIMDTPANLMTPTMFAQNAVEILCKSGVNVEVKVGGWAETQKMNAFLAVAKGSCEQPIFLELSYYGSKYDERPIVLIGSGITFDSGGICLREPHQMKHMRGDLAGAACVVAVTRALAALQLPINVRALIPLCENMPGCSAMKPGDIVTSMSGKNILIKNTACEGRLLLADTLYYSQNFWPRFVVDVGTLTKGIYTTMDTAATAVFTNSDHLWEKIHMAGVHTGDRMWRFPLWDYYTRQVTATREADIVNTGEGRGGSTCKAAAFLREFVPCGEWMHLDTYGVYRSNATDLLYLRKGMSGRPTRTLIEFISQLVCKPCNPD